MKRLLLLLVMANCMLISRSQVFSFTFEGIVRTYKVHIPPDYTPDSLYPMIFNLHGYGSNAIEQQLYTGFDFVADTAGIIMVYPDGVNQSWNVYSTTGVNDVGFLSPLIDTMSAGFSIDQSRVYSTGMSMGGFMSYRLACQLENRIAAIASVAGVLVFDPCTPARPVPVMQMHGTADAIVPYYTVASTIEHWVNYNNCPATPVITDLPDTDTTDQCTVTVSYYGLCDDSTEVILYTINGGEHTWPGATILIGVTNYDIDGSTEIWNFFKKYSLNAPVFISEIASQSYNVNFYPNPMAVSSTLEINNLSGKSFDLYIMSMNGQILKRYNNIHYERLALLREDLTAGVYIAEIRIDQFVIRRKLVLL